jgi:hypothetical protein
MLNKLSPKRSSAFLPVSIVFSFMDLLGAFKKRRYQRLFVFSPHLRRIIITSVAGNWLGVDR